MNVENAPGQRADFSIVNSEWNAADAQTVGLNVWEHLWLRAAVCVCARMYAKVEVCWRGGSFLCICTFLTHVRLSLR